LAGSRLENLNHLAGDDLGRTVAAGGCPTVLSRLAGEGLPYLAVVVPVQVPPAMAGAGSKLKAMRPVVNGFMMVCALS
jgi:hypothetical protein